MLTRVPDQIQRYDVHGEHEVNMRRLATELAMGILAPEDILQMHGIRDDATWMQIATNRQFQRMLAEETEIWGSGLNTRQRVDIKTMSMLEQSLPEMFKCLHDPSFAHVAKVKLFEALQRGSGIGVREGAQMATGEKVSITINLGEDRKIVIDHTPEPITLEGNLVEEAT